MEAGSCPVRRFLRMDSFWSLNKQPISSGISLTSLLWAWNAVRLEQRDKLVGIVPGKELSVSISVSSLNRFIISWEISPWKLLFAMLMCLRKLRFPTEGDKKPLKLWFRKSKWVTLWCRWAQVTPVHWHKFIELFHELVNPSASCLITFSEILSAFMVFHNYDLIWD